jgi:phospholipase/lecithinase/hemolysin
LAKLEELMSRSEMVNLNYRGKRMAISSFIQVFDHKIEDAIKQTELFLENQVNKITIQENLNLSLNLSGYYIIVGDYSKAVRILNFMSESDKYYQKEMGREC